MKKIKRIYKTFFEYEYCPEKNQVVSMCINDTFKAWPESVFNRLCDMDIIRGFTDHPKVLTLEQPVNSVCDLIPDIKINLSKVFRKIVSAKDKTHWVSNYIQWEIDLLNEELNKGTQEEELCEKHNFNHYQD